MVIGELMVAAPDDIETMPGALMVPPFIFNVVVPRMTAPPPPPPLAFKARLRGLPVAVMSWVRLILR